MNVNAGYKELLHENNSIADVLFWVLLEVCDDTDEAVHQYQSNLRSFIYGAFPRYSSSTTQFCFPLQLSSSWYFLNVSGVVMHTPLQVGAGAKIVPGTLSNGRGS